MKWIFSRILCGVLLLGATMALRAGTVSLRPDEVVALRALVTTNKAAAEQFAKERRLADAALKETPNPIVKVTTEGRLDADPGKIHSIECLDDTFKIAALAWTWAVTGDERYAAKAREYILAWARVNEPDGDAINETRFEPLIVGYDLLRPEFPAADRQTVDEWLRHKAQVLWADHRGLKENWYSHRLKIVGLIGWTIDDQTLIDEVVTGFHRQVNANFKPDGASTDFYLRDALHYHLYDVEPLLVLARVADRNGLDFFNYAATNGATLHSGVDFVVPFATGEKQHMEFVKSHVPFDRKRAENGQKEYQPHVWRPGEEAVEMFETAAWFRPEYGVLAAKLSRHEGQELYNWQLALNAVTRHGPEHEPERGGQGE